MLLRNEMQGKLNVSMSPNHKIPNHLVPLNSQPHLAKSRTFQRNTNDLGKPRIVKTPQTNDYFK